MFFQGAEKRLKAAKALKEKGETPEELLRSIKENEAAVAEAQRTVDAWKAIVGEKSRREEASKAEAERIATEKAEAERKTAEERERAEKEEEARVEAERKAEEERIAKQKAEEERIAKQKAEEKTAEAESDKEEAEKRMDDEEPKPLGSGVFGNIYNQFKGKVKEAFDFLMKHKGGDLLGVFHRKDVGDIDLVWGDHGGGLAHIIRRHIIEQNDFKNVDEIQKVIEDVIRNGLIVRENKDKINIEYNGYRVSIKKTIRDSKGNVVENKNWIVTAFDKSKPKHEKRNPSSSETLTTPSANQKADGVTLPSNEDSIDKGSKKAEKKQKKQSVFDKAKEIADKEEKKRKAEAEDDSALGQATRAVGKKKKVNLFKYTASKIISYPALRGVHYANGYAYASDGYILFKEKADYPKEWEGTTRDKDGNLIDGKYPDTEKAIHRLVHIPDKEAVSLPSKEVLDFAIAASKKLKGEAIPVAIDGLFFNAVNLKKFLEAVASKGMDKVVYRHPMLYATNGKDEIVMMPTVNTLEGALDIADKMESAGLPKEQIDAWKAHIEAADKKKSFDDFKKAVENAKKEGVRPTEAEKPKEQPLTEVERKDAEEVAGALGYRVEWVDTIEENGTIDADKKVIRIAKDAENPLVQVLGHEVAHGVRRMIGGKFRTLQKAAKEVVGEKEWNERIEKKRKLNAYAEGKLAEEVTCDIVGEALNNKDALKRLAESLRGEKGILARLRDAVARMVEYFKNRGDKEGVRRMKAADKLLAEFESALKEDVAPEQVKPEDVDRSVRESRSEKTDLTAEERELRDNLVERMRKGGLDVVTDSEEMQRVIDTENERTRNMFVGERGATEADKAEEVSTRLDNLSVARRMEEAKKDAKTIKMATGWERGSDGKWRYETGDAKIKDTIELDGKTFKRYDEDMLWTSGKFGDVVDAPELFKAYPELRDVRIETDAVLNDMPSNGEYNPRTNTITIHSDDLKYQNSILNHEIQHAIQHIEGFETGGSAENVRERIQQVIDNSSDEVGYARERLREWADLNAMAAMLDVAYRKFVGSGNEWERAKAVEIYWDAINTIEDNDKAELAINYPHDKTPREVAESGYLVDDVIRELNRLADETRKEIPDGNIDTMRKVDRLVGALKDKTDFELYNRLAGEVEARNTEKRIGMTEEERRASLASETEDVAREDQILLGVDNADGEQRFLRTASGEVYGLAKDGRIYLTQRWLHRRLRYTNTRICGAIC
uniref:putative barnase/colicin E5 family endoribonuclease n=1 Tax=Candidatus Limisoma sp. TaxID=3076476 RepID=UPI004027EFF6